MNTKIFVFGNGNLSFDDYLLHYADKITTVINTFNPHFIVCDFRGVDTLTMELLKSLTPHVTVLHIGERPRYLVDKFKTKADKWDIVGGFNSDAERDLHAINLCTHFLAFDFNSDEKKSGTLKNIEMCHKQNKILLT